MSRPRYMAQDPSLPSTPRTPTSKATGAHQDERGPDEGFKITTPRAPKAPTIAPILYEPKSPSPMPISRSRRDNPLSTLTHGLTRHESKRDLQQHQGITAANGVDVREEDYKEETVAQQYSSTNADPHTQARLIVSIPLSPAKRPLEERTGHSQDTPLKQRRITHASRNHLDRIVRRSSKDSNSIYDPSQEQEGKIGADANIDSCQTSYRSSSRSARDERNELHQEENMDIETPELPTQSRVVVSWNSPIKDTEVEKADANNTIVRTKYETAAELSTTHQGVTERFVGDPDLAIKGEDDNQQEERYHDIDINDDDQPCAASEYMLREMRDFEQGFQTLQGKFKLLGKIGEGTFSSVYKAIDLEYDKYDNSDWDYSLEEIPTAKGTDTKDVTSNSKGNSPTVTRPGKSEGGKVVAIKRIYVTSSPTRIENEIAILHDLSGHKNVVPLITATRFMDQVIIVLPYIEHSDFRQYYRRLPMDDIRCYLRALLKGLAHVHSKGIIHRDIKPSNFLYDTVKRTGVVVDFGLAHREDPWPPEAQARPISMSRGTKSSKTLHNILQQTKTQSSQLENKQAASASSKSSSGASAIVTPASTSVSKPAIFATPTAGHRINDPLTVVTPETSTPRTNDPAAFDSQYSIRRNSGPLAVVAPQPSISGINAPPATDSQHLIQRSNNPFAVSTQHLIQRTNNTPTVSPHQPLSQRNNSLSAMAGSQSASQPNNNPVYAVALQPSQRITNPLNATAVQPLVHETKVSTNVAAHGVAALPPSKMPSMINHARPRPATKGAYISTLNPTTSAMMGKREPRVFRKDPRPHIRVNRAGTKGFRSPEILFKHIRQTVALDIWSVGVILISFLTGRFPFFNSNDDAEALLEIGVLFGKFELERAAASMNRTFLTNVPSVKDHGISLVRVCQLLHPGRFAPPEGYLSRSERRRAAAETSVDPPTLSINPQDQQHSTSHAQQTQGVAQGTADPADAVGVDPGSPQFYDEDLPNTENTPLHELLVPETSTEACVKVEEQRNRSKAGGPVVEGAAQGHEKTNSNGVKVGEATGSSGDTAKVRRKIVGWDSQEDLEQALSLLLRLMALNPAERATAEEALKHPFLAERKP
ncbi:hypothetical protein BC939DRAFT_440059 [Gamsiella multidivaricata]|uniref:uncharacterized protein n=1 Tax=Gamsiella multidivaricata TaxID=101098 RepID=UPI00221E52B9|nr:uncharacterized protein BC939DRAFT_440059 [Gamsiella multidivaricata]KAG0365681.1 hypothetical protein BGZ54_006299 [Gamsiella multidivaricata]KAI7830273.1 hypothetical protein BC939DRAFT_440059 [Gamsiella multidivaricata]